MNKIGWCDVTINPVKGLCPVGCSYCYARKFYKRYKWDTEIRYRNDVFMTLPGKNYPKRVFVGSTMELFGDWVKPEWMQDIMDFVRYYSWHTFIFLTKQPQNLIKFSPFPENCWIGSSATNADQLSAAYVGLGRIEASVKFLSYEPLLNNIVMEPQFLQDAGISWVIVGQQTPVCASTQSQISWIKEIVEAANKSNVPVFLKNNLQSVFKKAFDIDKSDGYLLPAWAGETSGAYRKLRQEFPKVVKNAQ